MLIRDKIVLYVQRIARMLHYVIALVILLMILLIKYVIHALTNARNVSLMQQIVHNVLLIEYIFLIVNALRSFWMI